MKRKFVLSALIFSFIAYVIFYSLNSCSSPSEKEKKSQDTVATLSGDFIGDQKCGNCHQKEYADWKTSDHFHAMMVANDSTVLGNFNNVTYSANGVTSHFFKRDDKFFVNTEGRDGSNHDYEVRYTFGIRPLQQYLIPFPDGKMQCTRQCWDVKNKTWFQQYPGQNIDHRDWLHWTGGAQTWNVMCASCHSTNLRMNYVTATDSFHTTWAIINVSCESCHGPGRKHVDYVSSSDYDKKEKVPGSYLVLHSNQSSAEQITACAPCHSRRMTIDESPFQTLQLLDHYIPEVPHTPLYHADGQIDEEVYEYSSFTQSRMFMHNVKCSNCHNPHSGSLVKVGNALCLQCHDKKLDSPDHFFHAVNSEGAQCINCHMPTKYYMVEDLRRDHSFRVPRPDLSVKYNTPNACNNCHEDKSAKWAADQIVKWFGPDRRYHFSDDLIPGSLGIAESAAHLQKLCVADTNVPAMAHATALYYMSFIYDEKNIASLNAGLKNNDPLIRYEALRSLRYYPVEQWMNEAKPLLNDPVKGVRIAATDLLLEYSDSLDANYLSAFSSGRTELDYFLQVQAPFPTGRMMMGDVQSRLKNYTAAEKDYLKAIEMDSLLVPARINLSTMYDIIGRKEDALKQLLIASKIEPGNDQVNYYLALVYVEMNDDAKALNAFAKASTTSSNPRVFYNYGLLLQQSHRDNEAEKIYKKGLAIAPDDHDLNYVMALFYYNHKRNDEAVPYAMKLMQLMPQNPNYQQLYKVLTGK